MRDGEIAEADPQVLAWALMGVGEAIGMRWILWGEEASEVPDDVLDEVLAFIVRGPRRRPRQRVSALSPAAPAPVPDPDR